MIKSNQIKSNQIYSPHTHDEFCMRTKVLRWMAIMGARRNGQGGTCCEVFFCISSYSSSV